MHEKTYFDRKIITGSVKQSDQNLLIEIVNWHINVAKNTIHIQRHHKSTQDLEELVLTTKKCKKRNKVEKYQKISQISQKRATL